MEDKEYIGLNTLVKPIGSRTSRIRRGRGLGSGLGKTAGRGGKGQTARAGKGRPKGFEGGQMPLYRRLPKFGFKNPYRVHYIVVNLGTLESLFDNGSVIDPELLAEKKIIKFTPSHRLIKILGEGTLTKKLHIKAHKFSKSAIKKINELGGKAEEIISQKKKALLGQTTEID